MAERSHVALTCAPFGAEHVPVASAAAAAAAARLRARVPVLPARWLDPAEQADVLAPLAAGGTGWVALADGAYAGHLVAATFGSGTARATYAPTAGFAVAPGIGAPMARRVIEELVTWASRAWVASGIRTHLVGVPFDDATARDALAWLGYGVLVIDALRGLDDASLAALPDTPPPGVRIRRAGPGDLPAVLALDRGLRRHLVEAPTFLVLAQPQDPDAIAARLAERGTATFLAERAGEAVAFLRVGPTGDDVATLVRDPATLGIDAAFTRTADRDLGTAAALLGAAAGWAREQGARRLGVDFESANVLGGRFWRRWFTPVVASCVRRLDPAAGSAAALPDHEDPTGTDAP